MRDLSNKRSIINILLNANSNDIKEKIYPVLKKRLNDTVCEKELVNIIWLFGRLRLYDETLLEKSLEILSNTENYETKYYILQAMIDDPKPLYKDYFKQFLYSDDILIKRMAINGLAELGSYSDIATLEEMLYNEDNSGIIACLSKAIYRINNDYFREESINVMGHLFGRDAAIEILKEKRTMWWMALGITWDTKETLAKKIKR